MSGSRLPSGGLIDRGRTLSFTFDGKAYTGHPGDTLASALLANGVRVMGRSFKYHRPRGVWGAWFDDPNAIFNIRLGDVARPNCPAATTLLEDGMEARSVNAFPNAGFDIKGGLDLFHRFLSAGFYYKMFMWPDWHLFEPAIRKMAGLGALEGAPLDGFHADQRHDACDLLVVGGGAAGLQAALSAARAGQDVVLVDDHPELGGSLYQLAEIDGQTPSDWVATMHAAIIEADGRILTGATAFGVYDHQMIGLAQERGFTRAPALIRMRARRCILATGALDRPATFAMNDRPGVMSLNAAAEFAGRYGVLVGQTPAVLAHHSMVQAQLAALTGSETQMIDAGTKTPEALGRKSVTGLRVGSQTHICDAVLNSAGLMPIVHLWRHAGGKLTWDEAAQAFVPDNALDWMQAVGAANGTFDLDDALAEAEAVALGADRPARNVQYTANPPQPALGSKKRQWIDYQHDVTLKDIELAARENYVSVEHLKRYTTLGMASDQGKTSNVAGLSAMARLQGKEIPEVGTTTFRPPFVPLPMELYRGHHRGAQFHPLKRLPLEPEHRAAGAALGEYGGWLRPGWYGTGDPHDIAQSEALMARHSAAIFDGSPLGKIEVMGPDAEAFVNFIYYNTIKTLKPGAIRYGFMLTEGGVVYDDGVIARMGANRFVISCSSSHVDGVNAMLEAWRQDGHDPERTLVHDTTANWPTVTVTGPMARQIVAALDLGVDLSAQAFPHMQWRDGWFQGALARISRVSFTGDVSFEISVPVHKVTALWQAALASGAPLGAGPMGVEALSILRAEKGYLIIGKDTDGETMPHDLGFTVPRLKKSSAFVGDRGLHTENANRDNRRRLVGLSVPKGADPLPTGAHVVSGPATARRSHGYVTSSYHSPNLDRPIALGLVEASQAETGTKLEIQHLGAGYQATVCAPCAFDPEGERLHA